MAHGTRHIIESGTWDVGLYKEVRKKFFFIVITAKRRLKRHTPLKTNRQENGLSTVLLSFRGKQGRHKADLPCSPLLDDYKRPTDYYSTLTLFSNYRRNGQDRFTAPTAWLTNNRAVKSRHKKQVFCSSVLTALTRLQNTDLFNYLYMFLFLVVVVGNVEMWNCLAIPLFSLCLRFFLCG